MFSNMEMLYVFGDYAIAMVGFMAKRYEKERKNWVSSYGPINTNISM